MYESIHMSTGAHEVYGTEFPRARVADMWSGALAHPTEAKGSKPMASALCTQGQERCSVAETLNLVPGIRVRAHNHPHTPC